MEYFIKYLERKIEACDELGGLQREKAVYQSTLKEYRKAIAVIHCCGAFFLMITTELKSGEIYKVNHSRKGKFKLLVENQCDTWVTGLITEGTAKAILEENEREQFEEITIRKSLCSFVAV